jgi:hypothetical protein
VDKNFMKIWLSSLLSPFGKGQPLTSPPLQKGKHQHPPFGKGGEGGFQEQMLSCDKRLKTLSQHLRNNMSAAEKMSWLKLKGSQVFRQGCF